MTTTQTVIRELTRSVIVLGMHRSGTSVLSRALITLGVDFGKSFVDAEPDNPKGFFEDKDINALNVSFLRELGCNWHTLILPTNYPPEIEAKFINQALLLLKNKFSSQTLWGLKEPRITRLLPLWETAITSTKSDTRYILANRNPLSVADSLAKRDAIPRAQALALWALHQIDGLAAIIRNGGIVVDYDIMLQQPAAELKRIAQFIGQVIDEHKQQTFLEDFLDPGLRHSHYAKTVSSNSQLIDACMAFHESLSALARTEGALGDNQLIQAKHALNQARTSLAIHTDWCLAVDTIYKKVEYTQQELREAKTMMHRLQSQLTWIETRWPMRFSNSIKRLLMK